MNSKMTTPFTIVLGLVIPFILGGPGSPGLTNRWPEMTIRVYDYAATPASTVRQMKAEVEWILGVSGVSVLWLNCKGRDQTDRHARCAAPTNALELMLRIRRSSASDGLFRVNAHASPVAAAWTPVGGKFPHRLPGCRGTASRFQRRFIGDRPRVHNGP